MITLDNIVKEYNQKIVLHDISMIIEQGQSIAFTGHNGCGKSTLLKIIAGLVQPTKGNVNYERSFLFHYVPEHFPQMQLTAEKYRIKKTNPKLISRFLFSIHVEDTYEAFVKRKFAKSWRDTGAA